MIDAERTKLEVEVIRQFETVIDALVSSDFAEDDIVVFTDTVRTFLKFFDLRQYIMVALYDRVQQVYRGFKQAVNYRKLLSILLRLNDEELTDALETFLAKDKEPGSFLILIEEQTKLGMDTTRAVDLFVSLIVIHKYEIETIKQVVALVSPNQKSIVSRKILKKLVESKQEKYLVEFIKHFPEYRSLLPIL